MRFILILFFLFSAKFTLFGQCQFNLDSYTHVNCYSENTGSIDISFNDPNISFWWTGPNGFSSNSTNLSSLFSVLSSFSNVSVKVSLEDPSILPHYKYIDRFLSIWLFVIID